MPNGSTGRRDARGSIFFSYAWEDNVGRYVTAFYDAFVLGLKKHLGDDRGVLNDLGVEDYAELVFFDQENNPRTGVLDDNLKKKVAQANLMVVFAGDSYWRSDWCLTEWLAFRERLGGEALSRLLVVELEKDSVRRHMKSLERQGGAETAARFERLKDIESCIRNPFFHPDRTRLKAYLDMGSSVSLNQEFIDAVVPLVGEIVPKLLELPAHDALRPDPDVVRVVVGYGTNDVAEQVEDLEERLCAAGCDVHRVTDADLRLWAEEETKPALEAPQFVVLPFSLAKVKYPTAGDGGHLRMQLAWVPEGARVLWWHVAQWDTPAEPETRSPHKAALDGLAAGRFLTDRPDQELVAGGLDAVLRRVLPDDPSRRPMEARIVWESNLQVNGVLRRILKYTKERWNKEARFKEARLVIRSYDLSRYLRQANSLPRMHGLVLLGYSKAEEEIESIFEQIERKLDDLGYQVEPRTVFVDNTPTTSFFPSPLIFKRKRSADEESLEPEPEQELLDFLAEVRKLAETPAVHL